MNGMPHTSSASYRSGERQGCLRGTRVDVILQLEHWLKDEQDHQVFWLNGLAGTGKTAIAQTFAEICFADRNLGASFFCSRDFIDRSDLQVIFPTLAFQLAYQYPLFRKELLKVLRTNPDVGQESLYSQMERLIVGPLKATQIQTLIIIDALDECKDKSPESAILFVLSKHADQIPNVKFFITGRPEAQIRSGFCLPSLLPTTKEFRLHEVEHSLVDNDIKLFFRIKLADLVWNQSDFNLTEGWPSSFDIDILCEKAAGSFIYASTAIKFITSKKHPERRLAELISLPHSSFKEGRSGIDLLYVQILGQVVNNVDGDGDEFYSCFRTVVGTVLLVFSPLSVKALSTLLRISDISTTLHSLHFVLLIPNESNHDHIRVFHQSFPDFLMDPERCTDKRFYIKPSVHHQEILLSCLALIKGRFKMNICGLGDHTILSEMVDVPTRRKEHIGDALEYACQFWTRHLMMVPTGGCDFEEVHEAIKEFFIKYLLFWIEVLVVMGNLNASVYAINNIQQWYISVSFKHYQPNPKPTFYLGRLGLQVDR